MLQIQCRSRSILTRIAQFVIKFGKGINMSFKVTSGG